MSGLMGGREIVKKLEEDFRYSEEEIPVWLTRAQISGVLLWINAPHTRAEWGQAMREAQLALAWAFCTYGLSGAADRSAQLAVGSGRSARESGGPAESVLADQEGGG